MGRKLVAHRALRPVLVLTGLLACGDERRSPGQGLPPDSAGTSVAGSGGATGSGGGTSGTTAAAGGRDPGPLPTPPDCACLSEVSAPACRACLDATSLDGCAEAFAACEEDELDYCAIVLDCLALCPVPDAYCVDACLGSEGEGRSAVEAFAACACAACAGECGEGGCD